MALREFLHMDDLADAALFLLGLDDPPDWVNVGSGRGVLDARNWSTACATRVAPRAHCVGIRPTRWHAAQVARLLTPARPRLAPQDRSRRRSSPHGRRLPSRERWKAVCAARGIELQPPVHERYAFTSVIRWKTTSKQSPIPGCPAKRRRIISTKPNCSRYALRSLIVQHPL